MTISLGVIISPSTLFAFTGHPNKSRYFGMITLCRDDQTLLPSRSLRLTSAPRLSKKRTVNLIFILFRAGYSTQKRFVLGGEECAAPFSGRTLVAYLKDGCSPVDKGEIGLGH